MVDFINSKQIMKIMMTPIIGEAWWRHPLLLNTSNLTAKVQIHMCAWVFAVRKFLEKKLGHLTCKKPIMHPSLLSWLKHAKLSLSVNKKKRFHILTTIVHASVKICVFIWPHPLSNKSFTQLINGYNPYSIYVPTLLFVHP